MPRRSQNVRHRSYDRVIAETDYRHWLVQAHHEACGAFDKAVMSLAGGGLGLSITFVHEMAPNPTRTGRLVAAWICFLVSLTAVFISLLTTRGTLRSRITMLDTQKAWGRSILGALTTFLGWIAAVALVCGVVFLFLFAHANL